MKCIVVREFGFGPDVVHVADRPTPEPGPGQIRIRMRLSPIHRHDLMAITGRYGIRPSLPTIPGTEGFGIVDKVGAGVDRFVEGQRVAAMACNVWAEYFLAEAASTVPIADDLDDGVAAQLIAMPLSVRLLIRHLAPGPGDWLIFNAAGGTVGRLIESLTGSQGVNTVGIGRRGTSRLSTATPGTHFFAATDAPNWKDEVREMMGGAKARFAIDSVGGGAANELAEFVADGGRLTSFGVLSGRPLEVDAAHLLFRGITVDGFWAQRELPKLGHGELRTTIKLIIEAARCGALPVSMASTHDFASVGRALRAAGDTHGGKVLLCPGAG